MRPLWTVLAFSIVSFFYVVISAEAFVNGVSPMKSTPCLSRRPTIGSRLEMSAVKSFTTAVVAAVAPPVAAVAPSSVGTVVAKFLGYVIGAGSLAVYLPIVFSLLKKKSADGFSVATWVFNLMGITLAVIYPLKKGFPMSTFVELVLLVIQSTGILGLICYYQGLKKEYAIGLLAYILITAAIIAAPISSKVLSATQVAAILICNYANIPQIILTMKEKKASWSPITAFMSMGGNLIRIFTTIQLTKDPLVMSGYMLGFSTNLILFSQVLFYGSAGKTVTIPPPL